MVRGITCRIWSSWRRWLLLRRGCTGRWHGSGRRVCRRGADRGRDAQAARLGHGDNAAAVEKAIDADQFNDHAEASKAAAEFIAKAQAKLTRITTPEVEGAAV